MRNYHVEVVVSDREPEDAALRRFRREVRTAKIVHEMKRRRYFENRHDIRKRKMQERGLFKRLDDPSSWTEVHGTMEPSPFQDMFGKTDDIFSPEGPYAQPYPAQPQTYPGSQPPPYPGSPPQSSYPSY